MNNSTSVVSSLVGVRMLLDKILALPIISLPLEDRIVTGVADIDTLHELLHELEQQFMDTAMTACGMGEPEEKEQYLKLDDNGQAEFIRIKLEESGNRAKMISSLMAELSDTAEPALDACCVARKTGPVIIQNIDPVFQALLTPVKDAITLIQCTDGLPQSDHMETVLDVIEANDLFTTGHFRINPEDLRQHLNDEGNLTTLKG
jgi:hypothetical protein